MSATAATNQPMSITTRSALAARASATPARPARRSLVAQLRSWMAARQRMTPFARLSTSARQEFSDTDGLRQRSAPMQMRSGLDTFMR